MAILNAIWTFFATYILQKAPYMIGFLVLIGYLLKKEKWYNTLGGTLKAIKILFTVYSAFSRLSHVPSLAERMRQV